MKFKMISAENNEMIYSWFIAYKQRKFETIETSFEKLMSFIMLVN